jgi:DNA-binding MarR family transcriptional regulator
MTDEKADIQEEAFHLFGRLVTRSDPGRLEAWAGLGLTMTQLRVLFILRTEPGLTAGVLAERLGTTPSTLTRIMDRLVSSRLVRRVSDDDDRRLVRHYLSETGLETVGEMERQGRARMYEVFRRLTPEQLESVVYALRALNQAMDASDAEMDSSVGVRTWR